MIKFMLFLVISFTAAEAQVLSAAGAGYPLSPWFRSLCFDPIFAGFLSYCSPQYRPQRPPPPRSYGGPRRPTPYRYGDAAERSSDALEISKSVPEVARLPPAQLGLVTNRLRDDLVTGKISVEGLFPKQESPRLRDTLGDPRQPSPQTSYRGVKRPAHLATTEAPYESDFTTDSPVQRDPIQRPTQDIDFNALFPKQEPERQKPVLDALPEIDLNNLFVSEPLDRNITNDITPLELQGCERHTDGRCYKFMAEAETALNAQQICQNLGGCLALMTKANYKFLNDRVALSFNESDCNKKITILANQDPANQKYGTYAFTSGTGCTNFLDTCKPIDGCTLVDWKQKRPYICEQSPTIKAESCMKKIFEQGNMEILVSCEAESGIETMPRYPQTCIPVSLNDMKSPVYDTILNLVRTGAKDENISFLTSTRNDPNNDASELLKFCGTSQECSAFQQPIPFHKICRQEKRPILKRLKKAQLWEGGTVHFEFEGDMTTQQRAIFNEAISQLESVGSGACIRFRSKADEDVTSTVVIRKPENPTECRTLNYGRKAEKSIVLLGARCFDRVSLLLMPLLNVLGVPAEHRRHDRDNHLLLEYQNNPNRDAREAAEKQAIPSETELLPYDFESVTHAFAFGNTMTDRITFTPIDKTKQLKYQNFLSQGDKDKLKLLYGNCESVRVSRPRVV